MRPSRRVMQLTGVAVACGALLAGVALIGLDEPSGAISTLYDRIYPASQALERTGAGVTESQAFFLDAIASSPDARGGLVVKAQQAGNRANAAFRDYKRLAFGSPAELTLQRTYEKSVADGQGAGAVLFGLNSAADQEAYAAALTSEGDISTLTLATLDEIQHRFYDVPRGVELKRASDSLASTRSWILLAFVVVLAAGLVHAILLLRGAFRDERGVRRQDQDRRAEQHRADLENQLQRGLEMEPTEEDTYSVIGAGLELVRPDHPVEVLVADSSRAHFRQVLSTDPVRHGPGCPVTSPADCPAASSGQTRFFISSTRLDACPHLRSRDEPPQSATCVPISIAGTNTGMIHTVGPDSVAPQAHETGELELVARKAGDRIGYLRVLAQTETQARVDSLTGLINRRSLERSASELVAGGGEFVVAFADLDHFKNLNDEYGHEIGDRALRLFGRVLRDSVRPSDVPARYGGEEFVVLLPGCTLADARIVTNRVRESLAAAIGRATVPEFTVSIGLSAWIPPELFEDTVARADAALLGAKHAGRDRVLTSDEIPDSAEVRALGADAAPDALLPTPVRT